MNDFKDDVKDETFASPQPHVVATSAEANPATTTKRVLTRRQVNMYSIGGVIG